MKKLFILSLVGLASFSATAQETTLQETRFTDNWSVGLNGGIVTPLTHHAFWGNARSAVGVQLSKDVTPVFGFGIESMWTIHTSESRTAFDASNLSLLGRVNLTNLFAGYRDEPRLFEIEAMAGAGWLHYYANGEGDANGWSTKAGLNLNFNLGLERAWTIAIKPAVVWNMDGNDGINDYANFMPSHYDVNHANFELTAGIVYHFKGSNGAHHFTRVRLYDPYEVDELNAKINDLREAVSEKGAQLHQANGRINALSHEVKKLRDRGPVIQTQTVTNTRETLESVTRARDAAMAANGATRADAENKLTETLKNLFAISENYPTLRANENFLELQRELTDTETKIQAARQFYNNVVMGLNTQIEQFPSNLVARMFNIQQEKMFEMDEAEKKAPKVKF